MAESEIKPPIYQSPYDQLQSQQRPADYQVPQNLQPQEIAMSQPGQVQILPGGGQVNYIVNPVIQDGGFAGWSGPPIMAPPANIESAPVHHKVKPSPGFVLGIYLF